MQNILPLLFLALAAVFLIKRSMKYNRVRKEFSEHIKNGVVIIDVRTADEFKSGHLEKSINIPIQELTAKTDGFDKEETILLCCGSGMRSGMAVEILKSLGFKKAINAGPWHRLTD